MNTMEKFKEYLLQKNCTGLQDLCLLVEFINNTNLGTAKYQINLLKHNIEMKMFYTCNYLLVEGLGLKPNKCGDFIVGGKFLMDLKKDIPELMQVRL